MGVMPAVPEAIPDMSHSLPSKKPLEMSPFTGAPVLYIPVGNISSLVEKKFAVGPPAVVCGSGIWPDRSFAEFRYCISCMSFWFPDEYDVCDVDPPLDCELVVAGLGSSSAEMSISFSSGRAKLVEENVFCSRRLDVRFTCFVACDGTNGLAVCVSAEICVLAA
jgi:hypothetical protein